MRQIDKKMARDKVAAEMRRAILYGTFPPNSELSQDKVAAELGVSKMPVREAIQILAAEGLITFRPNRSPVVNDISDKYVKDHFEIRSLLEQEAVARAASSDIDPSELYECHQKALDAVEREDYSAFNFYNGRIHQIIWRLSGNIKLEQLLSHMWHTMHLDNYARENAMLSNQEHGVMIECIVGKDVEGGREIMKRHVIHSYEKILDLKRARMEKAGKS
jgi:DNA-binding GntR family transcriptional regulator